MSSCSSASSCSSLSSSSSSSSPPPSSPPSSSPSSNLLLLFLGGSPKYERHTLLVFLLLCIGFVFLLWFWLVSDCGLRIVWSGTKNFQVLRSPGPCAALKKQMCLTGREELDLGSPSSVLLHFFRGRQNDYTKKGTLILTSLLEDLAEVEGCLAKITMNSVAPISGT